MNKIEFYIFRLAFALLVVGCLPSRSVTAQELFVDEQAVLQFIEERRVPSLISGVIKTSYVQEATLLKIDQQVMEIDDAMATLDLSKLEKERDMTVKEASTTVELEYAKRSIEVAEAELGRALRSNQSQPGAIAMSEIDQLTMEVERAIAEKRKTEFQIELKQMQIKVRNAELAITQKRIENHRINSPLAGMVVEILKKEGEWVEASETVAKIARLDKLKTEIKMPATLALDNLQGRSATFTPNLKSLEGKSYDAKVIFVNPSANPVNAQVRVWVEIENGNLELIPGLTGKLVIMEEVQTPSQGKLGAASNAKLINQ